MNLLHHDSRLEIKNVTASGVFTGYGSVYESDPNKADLGEDIVAPGCFTDSLSEWKSKGDLPAMLWQHNSREPVGSYTAMREDSKGLAVEGQLMMKTQLGQYAHECLRTKAVSGLSIGFLTRDDTYDQKTGVRTIKKADLWEVSIVTFPMNPNARVDSVKAIPDNFESIAEFERFLRDTGGYSRNTVMLIMKRAKALFQRDTGADDESSQAILAALARGTALRT